VAPDLDPLPTAVIFRPDHNFDPVDEKNPFREAVKYIEVRNPSEVDTEWQKYAVRLNAKDKGLDLYGCQHTCKDKRGEIIRDDEDAPVLCSYVALKQTVKRHINSTHLDMT